jgi:hypothetical protein
MEKKMKKAALIAVGLLALTGCATQQERYEASLDQMPAPTDAADRQQKCAWLRGQIAQQQRIADTAREQTADLTGLATQANARSKVASLDSKTAQFGCNSVAADAPIPVRTVPPWQRPVPAAEAPGPSKIESCIAACKANTPRTPEQCFDACNH